MEREELMSYLRERGAIQEGHFRLSSGLHSGSYLQLALLLKDPVLGQKIGELIGKRFSQDQVDVVVGPALGGIIIAYLVGMALHRPALFTERQSNGEMLLKRGFTIDPGSKVLITEDVITTGKSAKETITVIQRLGGEVVGIACIVDRSTYPLHFPITSLICLDIKNYQEGDCPFCKRGIPFQVPGSRKL